VFKRGDVVKLKTDLLGLVGVVDWYQPESEPGAVVQWFVGGTHRNLCNPAHLTRVEGYEFEAALALGSAQMQSSDKRPAELWGIPIVQMPSTNTDLIGKILTIGSADDLAESWLSQFPYKFRVRYTMPDGQTHVGQCAAVSAERAVQGFIEEAGATSAEVIEQVQYGEPFKGEGSPGDLPDSSDCPI